MRFLIISNCQGEVIKSILEAGNAHTAEHVIVHTIDIATITPRFIRGFDAIIAQDIRPDRTDLWQAVATHPCVISFPWLLFYGFTPDHAVIAPKPASAIGPIDNISRIMAAAWKRGLSHAETRDLFAPEMIDAMGYRRDFNVQRNVFIENLSAYTSRAAYFFNLWFDRGIFFFSGNHPKSFVIEDILRDVLAPHGIDLPSVPISGFLPDPLAHHHIHPNLNHPDAQNVLDRKDHIYKCGTRLIPLDGMIAQTFALMESVKDDIEIAPRDLERFDTAYAAVVGRHPEPMRNPYATRPSHCFWSRAVARPARRDVCPGDDLTPVIGPQTRVATAGSCFAQHVARAMIRDGLTYYVAESAPAGMPPETAQARGYGLFSARYGNIYSTRQLVQLIHRAYGRFTPIETAWTVEGGFADPFRPNIGEIFPTVEAVETARAEHFTHVRRMFETLDVFVFTLGLTEGWIDRRDGAAYPVTPGAITKSADQANFAFHNLGYKQVKDDLSLFLKELLFINPKAKIILTVSPVPLIATYGDADVLSATTYSKSILRAAAGDTAARFDMVQYFPSYEIITGAFNRGSYFESDLRGIQPEGVAHVMDVFRQRLVMGAAKPAHTPQPEADALDIERVRRDIADEAARQMFVICDEELQINNL